MGNRSDGYRAPNLVEHPRRTKRLTPFAMETPLGSDCGSLRDGAGPYLGSSTGALAAPRSEPCNTTS